MPLWLSKKPAKSWFKNSPTWSAWSVGGAFNDLWVRVTSYIPKKKGHKELPGMVYLPTCFVDFLLNMGIFQPVMLVNSGVLGIKDLPGSQSRQQLEERWFFGTTPPPRMPVTTRIISFLVGNPYKPSFVTVTGWGVHQRDMYSSGPISSRRLNRREREFPQMVVVV